MKKHWSLVLFFFFSLLAVWPLLRSGFIPTHDGEYHLIRFWQFAKNIQAGNFFPRWAPDLDHGYGAPLFSFFYPWPNYAAEFFHLLGSSYIEAFKLSSALAFILSGLFFYRWLKEKWGPSAGGAALIGSLFYLYAPYHFLDLYVRGSIGELWGLVWLPAVLWAMKKKLLPLTALFEALLILSHNILALIFTFFLTTYALFFRKKNWWPSLLLGLGLSAYFWLPALVENHFVTGLQIINFADHFPALFQLIFPSWGTGFSLPGILDGMSFQIGLDHLFVVGLGLLFLFRRRQRPVLPLFFLAWFLVLVFLTLEVSLPFWRWLPGLKYCQYPWRLLALIIVTTSFLAGWLAWQMKSKPLIFLLMAMVFVFNYRYSRPVIYSPRVDSFYLENPDWNQGTATLGNSFKTIWAEEHPAFEQKLTVIEGEAVIKEKNIQPTNYSFLVNAAQESHLRVNTNYFPGWQVRVNGQETKISLERDGAFSFNLPEGKHQVKIQFRETKLRVLANLISLGSFIWLLVMVKLRKLKF